jgi:hypothetical protein
MAMRARLTRKRKIGLMALLVIAVLAAISVIPWGRFDPVPHNVAVTPAAAAAKGQRALRSNAGVYDWQVSNCRERAGKDAGHWRCDVRTGAKCHGWVLLDVFDEHSDKAEIWHVQNKVRRCAPYGFFGPIAPDSDWE